jgi:predicted regulator of Ras-like GTPase activity (Roadblock/LC7/MglB family)
MSSLFVISEDASGLYDRVEEIKSEIGAEFILVAHPGGTVIAEAGTLPVGDSSIFAALAAATFSSTGQIARLLGEKSFSNIVHNGSNRSVYMGAEDSSSVVIILFEGSSIAPDIHFKLPEYVKELQTSISQLGGTQTV